jgi:hypothetical protein
LDYKKSGVFLFKLDFERRAIMKRIAIISLAIVLLTTQYSYMLASCELCGTGVSEVLNGITKPDTESLEGMFIELDLGDDIV